MSEEEKVFAIDDEMNFKQNEPWSDDLEVEERAMVSL